MQKADQDLIDRLSDVAGPLSPGEKFSPYLTMYPLPSEAFYVVARTWQDLEAPRAGCVRTRSVLVPMSEWQFIEDVSSVTTAATFAGATRHAESRLHAEPTWPLAPIDPLQGAELLEALFLEERAPIVVFDAETPELLALRIVTALWPGFRRTFTMSTFARSPRTIDRRSFDLVFTSSDARSRFSDWKGRRIDGRRKGRARHPWSELLISNVLRARVPSLRQLDALGEMSSDSVGSEAALRVSLLWDELGRKLKESPTAALGMLDIVNTRRIPQGDRIRKLGPALAWSAQLAVRQMSAEDAWSYLGVLLQKLEGTVVPGVSKSVHDAALSLAVRNPRTTIDAVPSLNVEPQKGLLLGAAADGISRALDLSVATQLSNLDGDDLLELLFASPDLAKSSIGKYPIISSALAAALSSADIEVLGEAKRKLLGLLIDDQHVEPARLLIDELDASDLAEEAVRLNLINGLSSAGMRALLVERAWVLHAEDVLRDAVIGRNGETTGGSELIKATFRHSLQDIEWVLTSTYLEATRRAELVRSLLATANSPQLRVMLANPKALTGTINLLNAADRMDASLLAKIATYVAMPRSDLIAMVVELLPNLEGAIGAELVVKALKLALHQDPSLVPLRSLEQLLLAAGPELNGAMVMRIAMQRGGTAAAVSRNLIVFERARGRARASLLAGIEEMAKAIVARSELDMTVEAAEAAAAMLWESREANPRGFLRASATLLPFALANRQEAASPLIAAAFPAVYRGLAEENAFDVLRYIFVFLDWDKCKSARRRLADAFVHSEWRIIDIATAAARAGDPVRILGRISRERGGKAVLRSLGAELMSVPPELRDSIRETLGQLGVD